MWLATGRSHRDTLTTRHQHIMFFQVQPRQHVLLSYTAHVSKSWNVDPRHHSLHYWSSCLSFQQQCQQGRAATQPAWGRLQIWSCAYFSASQVNFSAVWLVISTAYECFTKLSMFRSVEYLTDRHYWSLLKANSMKKDLVPQQKCRPVWTDSCTCLMEPRHRSNSHVRQIVTW